MDLHPTSSSISNISNSTSNSNSSRSRRMDLDRGLLDSKTMGLRRNSMASLIP